MKYPDDFLNKIICGDCLEVMKEMPDECVDLIVTSPPYNNWRNRRTQKKREDYWRRTNIIYGNFDDKMPDNEYIKWQIQIINECTRLLKSTGTMCYNHKDRIYNFEVLSPLQWIIKTNAIIRQRVTWDRGGMQARNPVRFYRVEEDIYILGKQPHNFKWNKECAKYLSVWRINPSPRNSHPSSFPMELVKRCTKSFTNENDLILDPFNGSGTTTKIAKDLKRNFIGIEINPNYCKIAEERLAQGVL